MFVCEREGGEEGGGGGRRGKRAHLFTDLNVSVLAEC